MAYQRDISSAIKLLVVGLLLFVGYQVWLRPAYFAPSSMPQTPAEREPPASSPALALPESQPQPSWDVPPSRLVVVGSAPDPVLGMIHEELEKGNYDEVERRLKTLSQKKLTNVPARHYVAGLWNNLGVQQETFGGTTLSVKAFQQSVIWDPANPLAHLNLTQAYWELRDPSMTPRFLATVIRLAPQEPFPHLALADLLLAKGMGPQAAAHLDQARARTERDPNLQSYVRKLSANVEALALAKAGQRNASQPLQSSRQNMAQAPKPPSMPLSSPAAEPASQTLAAELPPPQTPPRQPPHLNTAHFSIQFDGPPDEATWTQMRAILEYAYEELSQKFGHVPLRPITVILDTNQKFAGTTGSPAWADALFDRSSGAIHVPAQDALEDLAVFSRTVRHEFAHALLYEYLKGQVAQVPTWLIEGLAIQLAEDPWPDIEATTVTAQTVIPITALQGEWKQLPGESQLIAYIEAASTIQTMTDRFSMYNVRQLLHLLQTGQSIDAAMQRKFVLSYKEFEHLWADQFTSQMKSRKS